MPGGYYLAAWQALSYMHLGRWSEAGTFAAFRAGTRDNTSTISRIMALLALGRLRARRGDPDAWAALDEALELSQRRQDAPAPGPGARRPRRGRVARGRSRARRRGGGAGDRPGARASPSLAHRRAGLVAAQGPAARRRTSPAPRSRGGSSSRGNGASPPPRGLRSTAHTRPPGRCSIRRPRRGRGGPRGVRPARCPPGGGARRPSPARARRADHPARPPPATRSNPAGLTARELEVLSLVAGGLPNQRDRRPPLPLDADGRPSRLGGSSASSESPAGRMSRPRPRAPGIDLQNGQSAAPD